MTRSNDLANDLDSPERFHEIRNTLDTKRSLRNWYIQAYEKFRKSLKFCPKDGLAVEIGSGCGFIKTVIPEMVTAEDRKSVV